MNCHSNKRKVCVRAAAILTVLCASACGGARHDDFQGAHAGTGWRGEGGTWQVVDGRYAHTREKTDGGAAYAVSPFPIADGTIAVRATATQHNRVNGGGCFGIAKYMDADNWYAVRYGSYGAVAVVVHAGGKRRIISTGYHFRPKRDQTYDARILIKGSRLLVCLDKRAIAVVEGLPVFDGPTYAGLFALSACAFDDVQVSKELLPE